MNLNTRTEKKHAGLTLVELVMTIAIIAVLASIAYPSYINYIRRSYRYDALASLSKLQLIMERCAAHHFSYSAPCTALPTFPHNSTRGYYKITLTNLSTSRYTLTARAINAQLGDSTCALMSLNQDNLKTALNSTGTNQPTCWTL
jgi:type IV pilus assembly protein PilE